MPGVAFTVTHATERRRRALRAQLAETNGKIRRLVLRMLRYEEDMAELRKGGQRLSDEEREKYAELRDQLDEIQATEVDAAWIRWAVSDLEGYKRGDQTLTMEDLDDLHSTLYAEMLRYAQSEAGVGGLDVKNSKSPSTSTARVDGETQPSTATPAAKATAS